MLRIFFDDRLFQEQPLPSYGKIAITPSPGTTRVMLKLAVPIRDLHCYWAPECRTPSQKLHWTIESISSAAKSFPCLVFFDLTGENRALLALDNLVDDTRIHAVINQEAGTYDVTVTTRTGAPFAFTFDRRPRPWQACLADWRDSLGIVRPDFPAGAWEPVFCSWYAVHAAVTQDWVEANAAIAAKLGCGTLIIDDGWCFDLAKRVSPKYIGNWYCAIGDWEVSAVKFPDFRNHVKRMQKLGLRYLLWTAPPLIGVESRVIDEIRDGLGPDCREGSYTLNPNSRRAVELITGKIARLVGEYNLDGLKIDFIDYLLPDQETPTGRAALELMAGLARQIRAAKADALIEFRQHYATPATLPYATQFRAGDVPYDFLDNFNRLCQLRVTLGDRIPIHADPIFWRDDESEVNIARHLIASLAGVPMLSMDLTGLGEGATALIRHWLDFYRDHRETLNRGSWRIHYKLANAAAAEVTGRGERIVFVNDPDLLPAILAEAGPGKLIVLNLTGETLPLAGGSAFDGRGRSIPGGCIMPGGYGEKGI